MYFMEAFFGLSFFINDLANEMKTKCKMLSDDNMNNAHDDINRLINLKNT